MNIRSTLWITCILLIIFVMPAWAAKTYRTISPVQIYDAPNGQVIETWPSHTLFTSNKEDSAWVRVSGHFPEGEWQSIFPMLYVKNSQRIEEQHPQTSNAPATIFHVSETLFSDSQKQAKAYKLLEDTPVFDAQGNVIEQWLAGKVFTSALQTEDSIKVTGHFPDGNWLRLEQAVYLIKPVRLQDRSQPSQIDREANAKRFVVIDKQAFEMTVYEQQAEQIKPILTSPVALGYDRCLSDEQGGKCYYTPEGEFEIEFKLFDTDGIKWCIPKKMEAEFADKIARGQRCWRGIMGNHALHFGNSLFLHGTSNPKSIGSRTTHGCVRMRNSDIEKVYRLLAPGDKVFITERAELLLAELQTPAVQVDISVME